jgi:hypothetical protein
MGAPMMIGAALGGGLSAARGGNPLLGALLGGVGGGVFGAAGGGAAAAANAGAGLAPAATGLKLGAAGATGLTAPAAFSGAGLAPAASSLAPGVANLAPPAMSGVGLAPAATSVGLMDTLSQLPKSFMQFSRENPVAMNLASNAAQEEFRQKQIPSPGLLRGSPGQPEPSVLSQLAVPQISLL